MCPEVCFHGYIQSHQVKINSYSAYGSLKEGDQQAIGHRWLVQERDLDWKEKIWEQTCGW